MQIRKAREKDAEQLARAEWRTSAESEGRLVARPGEVPVRAFKDKIRFLSEREYGLYVVAESNEDLLGHLLLEPLPMMATRHVAQLTVVVHPGHTGKGHGRALLEHAIAWARNTESVEKIELRVRSTNERAIGLYESLGFCREGQLLNRVKLEEGYAHDICMALFVDDPRG